MHSDDLPALCAHEESDFSALWKEVKGTPSHCLGHTDFHLGHTSGHTFLRIAAEHARPTRNKKPAITRVYRGFAEVGGSLRKPCYFPMQKLANGRKAAPLLDFLFSVGAHGHTFGHTNGTHAPLCPKSSSSADFAILRNRFSRPGHQEDQGPSPPAADSSAQSVRPCPPMTHWRKHYALL